MSASHPQVPHDPSQKQGAPLAPGNEVEAEPVAHFPGRNVLRGFVEAFAAACREGIPATVLNGHVVVGTSEADGSAISIDSAGNRRRVLQDLLVQYERQKRRAAREIEISETDEAWRLQDWRERERTAHRKVIEVTQQLAELSKDKPVETPAHFVTYADLLTQAASGLLAPNARITQKQKQALDTILADFRILPTSDGQWHASATVRLSMPGGQLAELGPFSWPVGAGGNGTALAAARRNVTRTRAQREALLTIWREYESMVPRAALATLLKAPFPELAHCVFHGIDKRPLPEWVGPQWRHPAFVAWVTSVYTAKDFAWMSHGQYTSFSHSRQFVAHLAAELGEISVQDVWDTVSSPLPQVMQWCAVDYGLSKHIRKWHSCVTPAATKSRPPTFVSVRCECGQPASVVVRVPEVPRDLLCPTCRRMPEAQRFEMPSGVTFPDEYVTVLRLTKAQCLAELRRPKGWKPSEVQARILAQTDLLTQGASSAQLAQRTGLSTSNAAHHLSLLSGRRLIRREGETRYRWFLAQ